MEEVDRLKIANEICAIYIWLKLTDDFYRFGFKFGEKSIKTGNVILVNQRQVLR